MSFQRIHILDTAVATDNIGDEIIVNACRAELSKVLRDSYVTTSSSHDGLGPRGRRHADTADLIFLLGTNALSATATKSGTLANWHVPKDDFSALCGKVILVGVGAKRSFDCVENKQRQFLQNVLSSKFFHSVRDESALAILDAVKLRGINTTCPTLWGWNDVKSRVPRERAADVCFSLTGHKPDPHADRAMIDILRKSYKYLWFWPQQQGDIPYLKSLDRIDGVSIIPPNLASYEAFLSDHRVDVIGTRLHGTIFGLTHGHRSIVVAIDNRAQEIAADTNLPTVKRSEIVPRLSGLIETNWEPQLHIDLSARDRFLGQFAEQSRRSLDDASTIVSRISSPSKAHVGKMTLSLLAGKIAPRVAGLLSKAHSAQRRT